MRVIAALTNQWVDCDGPNGGAGAFKDEAWYEGGYAASVAPGTTVPYKDWATEIAARYKDDETILAWQLVNEAEVKPSGASGSCSVNAAQLLHDFAADVSGAIKSVDPNHLVSLGTIGGGQCGAQGAEYATVHAPATIDLCEYHDYGSPTTPIPGDQWNGLQVRIDQCNALGKPLFVGEVGIRPQDVGGTLAARAQAYETKLAAQFNAGVVGELVWAWSALGSKTNDYDVGPGDPVVPMLARVDPLPTGFGFLRYWGGWSSGIFGGLDGIAVSNDGFVYVPDSGHQQVSQFVTDGTFVRAWGSYGSGAGQFAYPFSLDVDAAGNVYVADSSNYRIQKFDRNGAYLAQWGSQGSGNGQFGQFANDVVVASDGKVWVADPGRLQVFDQSGGFVRSLPIQSPGFDLDADGTIYVIANDRVKVYTPGGALVREWGESGHGPGQLYVAGPIDVDPHGYVWINDGNNHRIQKFTGTGTFLAAYGSQGFDTPGKFSNPGDVYTDASGTLFIADSGGGRVQVYGVPPAASTPTDTTPPTITIDAPANTDYELGESVNASFSCADAGGAGVATCIGDVPSGFPLDTGSLGGRSFNVTAVDNAGNVTTSSHVYTVVSPPTAGRAYVDQPDDRTGSQIHLVYAVPSDGDDRLLDVDGTIAGTVASAEAWLAGQTGGRSFRLDTANGEPDITFFQLSRTNQEIEDEGAFVRDAIEDELVAAGFDDPTKIYAVHYDGTSTWSCGGGAWPPTLPGTVAALYLHGLQSGPVPCETNSFAGAGDPPGYWEFSFLHEIVHTLGFVAACAPNHTLNGHVSTPTNDLMYAGTAPWNLSGVALDAGNDDYFGHDDPGCADLADSPFLADVAAATAPPGGTVTTDPGGTGPSPDDPVEVSVTTPTGGPVSIDEGPSSGGSPVGFTLLGQQVSITAPVESAGSPLRIVLTVDPSIVPAGETALTLQVFRNGALVGECPGASSASPDPCVSAREDLAGGAARITVLTSHASTWALGVAGGALAPSCAGPPPAGAIVGTPGADRLTGTARNDVIFGLGGDDRIDPGKGNDVVCAGAGRDRVDGGEGNDALDGGGGADELDGGAGNDRLAGSDGADALSGGAGNDALAGGDGADKLDGGAGNDLLAGSDGADALDGGAGNDALAGGDGADKLDGGAGDDALGGGNGNDALSGGAGADVLDGGPGNDRLDGGAGTDTCRAGEQKSGCER